MIRNSIRKSTSWLTPIKPEDKVFVYQLFT